MDEHEPTCVMHPFSYIDPPPSFSQGNSKMYRVEESVSFGRFVSDNLEWEKWSSFNTNRNRYVQEAQRYSRPGSVAQKKAYFEAHFKRIAALKAAALLEQANALQNSSNHQQLQRIDTSIQTMSISDTQMESNNPKGNENVKKHCEDEDAEASYVIHQNDKNETKENLCENVGPVEPPEPSYPNKVYSVAIKDEIQSCGTHQRDKPPLQKRSSFIEKSSDSIVNKNPPLSSYMSPAVGGGTARASLFENSVYPGKENVVTPTKNKTSLTDQDKKKTPLRLSINREFNRIISPVIRKIGTSKLSKHCSTPLKTPAKTPSAALESPRMTPSRGARSRLNSFAGDNKASGSRWHLFSSDASMSPSTGRQRISSPIIPNSFCLNGERASRRKQAMYFFRITMLTTSEHLILFLVFVLQKLEDKFNATAIERPPQSSKFKEKAEAELNKFRQSFCFKAMSSPDHLGENEALTSPKQKNGFTQGKSPKRGKQSAKTISKSFLPPRRPSNSVK